MATKSKTKSAKQRLEVKGLPSKAKTLSTKDAKKVKGGFRGGVFVAAGDINGDTTDNIIGAATGAGPHVRGK